MEIHFQLFSFRQSTEPWRTRNYGDWFVTYAYMVQILHSIETICNSQISCSNKLPFSSFILIMETLGGLLCRSINKFKELWTQSYEILNVRYAYI